MRKWVAIGVRLAVLLLALLILGGVGWQREHKDVEVMVLRDISESTNQVKNFPGALEQPLQAALDNYFNELAKDPTKKPDDRIGVISFHQEALIDALPSTKLALDTRAIREAGSGTDPASAIQLALASMSQGRHAPPAARLGRQPDRRQPGDGDRARRRRRRCRST